MRRPALSLATTAAAVLILAGCAAQPDPQPSPIEVHFSSITNGGTGDAWKPGDSATGTIDAALGTTLTIPVDVLNPNGTEFSPVAVVTTPGGVTYRCAVDDPRRAPSLATSTTSVEIACPHGLPTSARGVTLTVTDDE